LRREEAIPAQPEWREAWLQRSVVPAKLVPDIPEKRTLQWREKPDGKQSQRYEEIVGSMCNDAYFRRTGESLRARLQSVVLNTSGNRC
jgi:hypothetical protein